MGKGQGQAEIPRALNAAQAAGKRCAAAASSFLDFAARRVHGAGSEGAVVLVPSAAVADRFRDAWHRSGAISPAPFVTPLRDWAESVSLGRPVIPDSRRIALVRRALEERGWFPDADRWALAEALVRLGDELTDARVRLPQDLSQLVARLESAYRAEAGTALRFEARLVHELWHALAVDGLDGRQAYSLQLAALARRAPGPLFAVGLPELSAVEQDFLFAYRERAPVEIIDRPADSLTAFLDAVWPHGAEQPLAERARAFRALHPASPLAGRLRLLPAHGLEDEAAAVDAQTRAWLAEGKSRIALVALDRLTARRARALLERAGVLVQDEAGWTFSTLAASAALMRWLDAIESRFHYRDLLDLLKSPFVFADGTPRRSIVEHLEQWVRRRSAARPLDAYLAEGEDEATCAALRRLRDAATPMGGGSCSLGAWIDRLRASLDSIGMAAGLADDAAGRQLLDLLANLRAEMDGDGAELSFCQWRRWLDRHLEAALFCDSGIASPVVMTSLKGTRLREFDAALLIGADRAHLPGCAPDNRFFNQSVRAELGLPTFERDLRQVRADLVGLIADTPALRVTWQASRDAEPNPASPYVELLQTFHAVAYGNDLVDGDAAALVARFELPPPDAELPIASAAPAPSVPAGLVPGAISASGYNSLMACPYQFFARHVLGLGELFEVREEIEKGDYGEIVHRILRRFHDQFRQAAGHDRTLLERELDAITDAVFQESVERDYFARAWTGRWKRIMRGYLDWQLESEAAGWRFHGGELLRSVTIPVADGRVLELRGRLDRVDVRAGGTEYRVVDYKTQGISILKAKLADPHEDVQLACYAVLLQQPVAEAAYLSLDRDRTALLPVDGDMATIGAEVRARLEELFRRLLAGGALPAHGGMEACSRCEMRGICRRDYWRREEPCS